MRAMQTLSNSQRSEKKRPAVDPSNPPPTSAAPEPTSQIQSSARTSSASSRSSTYRKANPGQQLSQIEKSVTHLLIATKQLLETLTQWSRHNATEGDVSDVYVRLGYEFNIACRAFNSIGVDTADLGPVPELLRTILEETLSQEANPASLDLFLPQIRDIIIGLLHGLKKKQQRLRSKNGKDGGPSGAGSSSLGSTGSSSSLNSGLTQMLEEVPARKSGVQSSERRAGSGSTLTGHTTGGEMTNGDDQSVPPRFSSIQTSRQNSGGGLGDILSRSSNRESQRRMPASFSDSSLSSTASQSTSLLLPPPDGETLSNHQAMATQLPSSQSQRDTLPNMQPPPPPPPKQQDALAALQRGGDLERRASRRYSAYQISRHLGASPNGVPMLPPAQNSPVPNRGRDVRESMNAVRVRGSGILSRQKSVNVKEPSPVRNNTFAYRISEESSHSNEAQDGRPPSDVHNAGELSSKAPDGPTGPAAKSPDTDQPKMRATLTGPTDGLPAYSTADVDDLESIRRLPRVTADGKTSYPQPVDGDQTSQDFVPEQSPQPGKELTLFLQYKSQIKKFLLPEGSDDLSMARLQLAFIEKFAWNTHNNGNDLPEIYIQDPVSGVRHELEDLRDVKDRSVLVLNVEVLDEVKRHIDEGLGGLRRMVEGVRNVVDGQQSALQRVSERQQDTTREMARLSTTPKVNSTPMRSVERPKVNGVQPSTSAISKNPKVPANQITGIQDLRQDLAVVRQTFSSLVSDMSSSMATVQSSASSIKTMAIEGVLPGLDASTGRAYVNSGKKSLGEESENIVNSVDDLQDIVEDLRKDVVMRGVRPLPRQLETVSKSISTATADLKKMQEFLRREKPIWTKIWEKELELVCNDRDLLTMQEELAADLEDDLDKATQTFALVEQATKQQNLQSGQGNAASLRSTSKGLAAISSDQVMDPMKAKDGVLGEVRALRPNHETRLQAIERVEKARQKELDTPREGPLTKELGSFVEEGRLKKSGGVEEAERLRKAKDDKNRREAWEKQQEMAASKSNRVETAPSASDTPSEPLANEDDSASHEQKSSETSERPAEEEQVAPVEEDSSRKSWLGAIFTS